MKYSGIPASQGIAVGSVHVYQPLDTQLTDLFLGKSPERQIAIYREVSNKALAELTVLQEKFSLEENAQAAIFEAHCDILTDDVMEDEILEQIRSNTNSLTDAIRDVYGKYIAVMAAQSNPMFQERAKDMEDVRNRLLRLCANGTNSQLVPDHPCILVAKDLLPSDTAMLDRNNVLAIVTEQGGQTSHTAIIARSYGIPAVLGVTDIIKVLNEGQLLCVDACSGEVITEPDKSTQTTYRQKKTLWDQHLQEIQKYSNRPAVSLDGTPVDIYLNIGSARDEELAAKNTVDGVGLFRTEFLFLDREELPSEEEQTALYRKVLSAFYPNPVTLRTLDIGGDKKATCLPLPQEDNPFLGKRALRLCFAQQEVFRTQLRAALRASVAGRLFLMFPMVGSLDDIVKAKEILQEVKEDLDAQRIPYDPQIKIGIMIEIPSIALLSDMAAEMVDFASIGSNDLCQYLMAADRLNPEVAPYYQSMNPALFRLVEKVISEFSARGKTVSLCGELGGNPLSAIVLFGLGLRKISMNADSVPQVKRALSHVRLSDAERAAQQVCTMGCQADVISYLKKEFPQI